MMKKFCSATASISVSDIASKKSSFFPAPPQAIIGILQFFDT